MDEFVVVGDGESFAVFAETGAFAGELVFLGGHDVGQGGVGEGGTSDED